VITLYRSPVRTEDLPEPVQPAYRRVQHAWETGLRLFALGVALIAVTAVLDFLLRLTLPAHTWRALDPIVGAIVFITSTSAAISIAAGGVWCLRVTERRYTPELRDVINALEASVDTDLVSPAA
jgi:hypothetical protein